MQYTISLKAGVPVRQGTGASFFLLMDTGAATSLDLTFRVHSQIAEHVTTAKRGLKAALHGGDRFTGIDFLSAVDCIATFIASDGVVDISQLDGANVNATIANAFPLPVSNDRGSPGLPVYVNGTISGNPTAVALADSAASPFTATISPIVAANANRVSLRLTNTGTSPIAVGSSSLTYATGAVVIQPGDTWVEERAANLSWYGICNTGLTTSLAIQQVTA